jgi:hypothetical protein
MSKGNSFEVYSEIDTPFVQIRKDVILELDVYDLAVYTHLMRYMNKASKKCHPSLNRLKEEIKIGKDRLIKSIKSLESKNLLRIEKATNTRNRYTFLQPNFGSRLERPPIEVVVETDQGSRLNRTEVVVETDPNNNNRTIINNNNKIEKAKPSPQTEHEFGLEVASFMNKIEGFDEVEARKFFDHYSEPDKKGKMLKDKQQTWDTRRRINRWMDNARQWGKANNNSEMRGLSFAEQDRLRAKKNREEAENYDFRTMYLKKLAEEEEKERLKNLNTIDQAGMVLNAIR